MAMYVITNQHQPEDCPELSDELSSHYEANRPSANVNVYCNCSSGEHRMFFLIDAPGPSEALLAVPSGFLRSGNTVTEVEEAYKYATGAQ